MSRSRSRSTIQLDVLLEDERDSTPAHIADAAEKSFDAIPGGKLIPLDRIDTWERQPRKSFDEEGIVELAASIAASGVLEPLVVRRHVTQPGRYIIIAGHRRLLAARRVHGSEDAEERARVEALPCVIREATDDSAFADALVENLVRKDLTRREMMDAVKVLQDEYKWTLREIARRTGRNQHDLSVLARIAADTDLSQLVADDIISPTALGVLVEEKHTPIRGTVVAAIRAGRVKTVSDVEEAVRAAHAAQDVPPPVVQVSDITHPAAPPHAPLDGRRAPVEVSDITHPADPQTTGVTHEDAPEHPTPPPRSAPRVTPVERVQSTLGASGTPVPTTTTAPSRVPVLYQPFVDWRARIYGEMDSLTTDERDTLARLLTVDVARIRERLTDRSPTT